MSHHGGGAVGSTPNSVLQSAMEGQGQAAGSKTSLPAPTHNADMSSINVVQAVAQSLNYNVDEGKRK